MFRTEESLLNLWKPRHCPECVSVRNVCHGRQPHQLPLLTPGPRPKPWTMNGRFSGLFVKVIISEHYEATGIEKRKWLQTCARLPWNKSHSCCISGWGQDNYHLSEKQKKKGHFTELVRAEQISHCPEMLLLCQGILNNNPPIHHAADVSVGIF